MKPLVFSDAEIYPNWACIVFKTQQGEHFKYIHTDACKLEPKYVRYFIEECTIVGFNFLNYDTIMLLLILQGASNLELYLTSVDIIEGYARPWEIFKSKKLDRYLLDVIDIMPVLKGQAGLKLYGARVHFPRLQELPFDPHSPVNYQQQQQLLSYCCNDCDVTEFLYYLIKSEIDLRIIMSKQYGMDLRSKSGPGIAASVLGSEYERLTQKTPYTPAIGSEVPLKMRYQKPDWISFKTDKYNQLLTEIENDTFKLNPETGHLILGTSVQDRIVQLQDRSVKLGIGGLHSIDGPGYYKSNIEQCIVDFDVTSHYPSMIINSNWFPTHLGPEYLDVYKSIVDRRITAKQAGDKDTANSLKLVINSSFGLFSNKHSILYCPNLLLNVTLSGQLSLLMLAERLESHGYYIISANTDGVVINPQRNDIEHVRVIVAEFERDTGLMMEDTWYSLYVRRAVNDYFTVVEGKDSLKAKGIFQSSYDDIEHNPTSNIIVDSIIEYFKSGIPVEQTILGSQDIRDFVSVRTVKGGAEKDGNYIGKIVRWYYSNSTNTGLNYIGSGNLVPKSINGMPAMDLPEHLPGDLNYKPYSTEANELLNTLNKPAGTGKNNKVFKYSAMGLAIIPWPHKGVTIAKPGHDFSTAASIGIQTGHRANTLAIKRIEPGTLTMGEWSFYQFHDARYPGAMKTVSKKLGFEVMYGGAIELTHVPTGTMKPLPNIIMNAIYNNLGLAQKRKVNDELEFLL